MRQMVLAVITGLLVGLTAPQAHAFDLTGTWQGKQVCKIATADGKERQVFRHDVLIMTQNGTEVRIFMPSLELLYVGLGFDRATNPNDGAIAFRLCGLSEDTTAEGEMGRASVSTKSLPHVSKFLATSVFADADEVDTCEWEYKRISTADPEVPACP